MNRKELILDLVNAGFSIEEALTMAEPKAEPAAEPADPEPAPKPADPEQAPKPEDPEPGIADIMAAVESIKKSIDTMTDVTRATARLYGVEKKTGESVDDILSKLG